MATYRPGRPYRPPKPDPNDEFEVEFVKAKVKGLEKVEKYFEEELEQEGYWDRFVREVKKEMEMAKERRLKVTAKMHPDVSDEFHKTPTDIIAAPGYWYVATPYTKFPRGISWAHDYACRAVANLWAAGAPAFSPIAHTHMVAANNFQGSRSWQHEAWMAIDEPMMRAAHGLIVVMLEGWSASKGVAEEIEFFKKRGRPIWFVIPQTWSWNKKA
jgi:Domain of unknown function (DUF1937)